MTQLSNMTSFEKLCHSTSYVKDAIAKIRSKPWAAPVGTAMSTTASIAECFNWLPGVGIIGGALKIGSSLLNPAPSLSDLSKQIKDIEKHMNGSSGYVREVLHKQISEIQYEMDNPQPELVQDYDMIRNEIQSSAVIICKDMTKIDSDLTEVKNVVRQTYNLVIDSRYKDGIEKVDAAFQNFVKGSHNLEVTFASLANFMFELETNAIQSLNTEKISAYLKAIKQTEENAICEQVFQYIIIVRAKYLQISSAYYIYKQDAQRVTNEFESFNRDFTEIQRIYREMIGLDLNTDIASNGIRSDSGKDDLIFSQGCNSSTKEKAMDCSTINMSPHKIIDASYSYPTLGTENIKLQKAKSIRRKVSFFFLHETMHILKSRQIDDKIDDNMRNAMYVLETFENFLPALQYLGGALRIGALNSSRINCIKHLRKETSKLEESLIKSNDAKRKSSYQPLITEIKDKFKELEMKDLEILQEDLMKTIDAIRKETSTESTSNLTLQNLCNFYGEMSFDHQNLLEKIDQSYLKIIQGSKNLKVILSSLENTIQQICKESKAIIGPQQVLLHLNRLNQNKDIANNKQAVEYFINFILISLCKYLQIVVIHLTFNHMIEEMSSEFKYFVESYHGITRIYNEVTGDQFKPRSIPWKTLNQNNEMKIPSISSNKRSLDEISLDEKIEKFLKDNGLLNQDIIQAFVTQGVTFDILLDFTDEDLEKIGINELGYRKRILKAISKQYQEVTDGLNNGAPDCIPQVVIHHHHESYHIQPKHSYWSNIRAYVKKRKTKSAVTSPMVQRKTSYSSSLAAPPHVFQKQKSCPQLLISEHASIQHLLETGVIDQEQLLLNAEKGQWQMHEMENNKDKKPL